MTALQGKGPTAVTDAPPPNPSASPDRSAKPDKLASLDRQLIELLRQRRTVVQADLQKSPAELIGRMSRANEAIDQVLAEMLPATDSADADALDRAGVRDWLRHAASFCLRGGENQRVAFLGPKYSYSYMATTRFFGAAAALAPVQSIEAVFESVVAGDCRSGVVPIENSTDGRIVDTLGMFVVHRVHICGEVFLPIHHNLLSRSPREAIKQVCSKPQALSQCRHWLARHLPTAQIVEVASTTEAARIASEQPGVAAVAGREAGRQYGLDVVDANIEDSPYNVTRFAVLGNETIDATGRDKTTMLLQVAHKPGALADAMAIFKNNRLNLTWIESFPIVGENAEYFFFIECEGHRSDPPVAAAIDSLKKQAMRLDILGSYPAAQPASE
ncbi:prephenate dehydratase [Roseimaritima ulvae]|uniref:Bifunctional chorismate mutase/prephenate dehydratase n=1 Tax=Roseimaritima ulvae TaxID=980254 RepID=A0A5B9QNY2_9BACT|nr:prephenate dehydratase [Roseimaritima ulvae]QEG40674.1 Prephenate dehydratase [Roseimaritima ulvae]